MKFQIQEPFENQLKEIFGNKYKNNLESVPEVVTPFHSLRIPHIHINDYYKRVVNNTKGTDVLPAMWIYLKRIVYDAGVSIDNYSIHRLFSQAFNLALKFWDDDHVSEKQYCRIIGYNANEFAALEAHCIKLLSYRLLVGCSSQEELVKG